MGKGKEVLKPLQADNRYSWIRYSVNLSHQTLPCPQFPVTQCTHTLFLRKRFAAGEAADVGFDSRVNSFVNIDVGFSTKRFPAMAAIVRLGHLEMKLAMPHQSTLVPKGLETNQREVGEFDGVLRMR